MKAVIFDLGRVLVNMDVAKFNTKFFPQLCKENSDDQTLINIADDEHMHRYHRGEISPKEFYEICCEKCGATETQEEFEEAWNSIFLPMECIDDILYKLKLPIKMGLLSDTNKVHWIFCAKNYAHILNFFPNPTLSFLVGCTKPSKEIFIKAAEMVDEKPENCVFVDDLERNVEGAKALGMDAFQFKGVEHLENELVARNLISD